VKFGFRDLRVMHFIKNSHVVFNKLYSRS